MGIENQDHILTLRFACDKKLWLTLTLIKKKSLVDKLNFSTFFCTTALPTTQYYLPKNQIFRALTSSEEKT